jgi:hypothetical protein
MSVSGNWYNELGSVMSLSLEGSSITGTYQTAVGDANGIYQLVGRIDIDGDPSVTGQAIGWVVLWSNDANGSSHSITVWSGQYQIIDGVEEIEALWLLTSETPVDYDWTATQINKDIFIRSESSKETVMKASKKRKPAYPPAILTASQK